MTSRILLTLVAIVVGADDNSLEIDKGITDGLRPGDRGVAFYQLTIDGEIKRIELGSVEVMSLEAESATTSQIEGQSVKPGHLVEFEIDKERFSPANTVAAVRKHLGEAAAAELTERYLEDLRSVPTSSDAASPGAPPEAPSVAPSVAPPVAPAEASAHDQPVPDTSGPVRKMILLAAGDYPIGPDPGAASYYNETPRFEQALAAFWIDAAPAELTGYDFFQAQQHCTELGARLPTEFEWEVASGHPEFETLERFEWTSSWYLAYPGNRHAEGEYGEKFKVLRGSSDASSFRPQARRYFRPRESNSKVGFRCASSESAPDG